MKKGFTLIELLLAISIISLLASVLLTSLGKARARARDAAKTQTVGQIDLAIRLYTEDHGGIPPTLQGACGESVALNDSTIWNCIASSAAESRAAWGKFQSDLKPYLKQLPADDCGQAKCLPSYVYMPPAAMKYFAGKLHILVTNQTVQGSYQAYANLEANGEKFGTKSFGSFFDPYKEYVTVAARIGDADVPFENNGTCASNISYTTGQLVNNTGGCIRALEKEPGGTNYSVTWLSGFPVGANTGQAPTVSSSKQGQFLSFWLNFQ